jgi:hypothetical protein
MTIKHEEGTLDAVLFRFHREVVNPTPAIVAAWSREYPEYAAEIQAHAVEMLDLELRAETEVPDIESLEAEARSAGLNAVYEANRAQEAAPIACASLRDAAKQAGTSLREVADKVGIARAVVIDVDSIVPETVINKFLRGVSPLLRKDADLLRDVITLTRVRPIPQGLAFKASSQPAAGKPRTWREAIEASDMPDDRKAYWLSDED